MGNLSFIHWVDLQLSPAKKNIFVLEDQLPLLESELERHFSEVNALQDRQLQELKDKVQSAEEWNEESSYIFSEHSDLINLSYPLMYRSPFVVMLYAAYESALTDAAKKIQEVWNLNDSFRDMNGKNMLSRLSKYFEQYVGFILSNSKEWQTIRLLEKLRHAYAHAGGRIDSLKETQATELSNLIKTRNDIKQHFYWIILEKDFLELSLKTVKQSIDDLIGAIKTKDEQIKNAAT